MTTPTPRPRYKNRKVKAFRPEIPYEWRSRLKKLMIYSTATSNADVVRRALTIYTSMIEHQQSGWDLVLKRGTDEKPFPVN